MGRQVSLVATCILLLVASSAGLLNGIESKEFDCPGTLEFARVDRILVESINRLECPKLKDKINELLDVQTEAPQAANLATKALKELGSSEPSADENSSDRTLVNSDASHADPNRPFRPLLGRLVVDRLKELSILDGNLQDLGEHYTTVAPNGKNLKERDCPSWDPCPAEGFWPFLSINCDRYCCDGENTQYYCRVPKDCYETTSSPGPLRTCKPCPSTTIAPSTTTTTTTTAATTTTIRTTSTTKSPTTTTSRPPRPSPTKLPVLRTATIRGRHKNHGHQHKHAPSSTSCTPAAGASRDAIADLLQAASKTVFDRLLRRVSLWFGKPTDEGTTGQIETVRQLARTLADNYAAWRMPKRAILLDEQVAGCNLRTVSGQSPRWDMKKCKEPKCKCRWCKQCPPSRAYTTTQKPLICPPCPGEVKPTSNWEERR